MPHIACTRIHLHAPHAAIRGGECAMSGHTPPRPDLSCHASATCSVSVCRAHTRISHAAVVRHRRRLGLLCAQRIAVAPHALQLREQQRCMRRWWPDGFATRRVSKSTGHAEPPRRGAMACAWPVVWCAVAVCRRRAVCPHHLHAHTPPCPHILRLHLPTPRLLPEARDESTTPDTICLTAPGRSHGVPCGGEIWLCAPPTGIARVGERAGILPPPRPGPRSGRHDRMALGLEARATRWVRGRGSLSLRGAVR